MQYSNFDKLQRNQHQEISRRSIEIARSISQWGGKLFRSPFAIVLLVWGLLFLILSVALAYPQ